MELHTHVIFESAQSKTRIQLSSSELKDLKKQNSDIPFDFKETIPQESKL